MKVLLDENLPHELHGELVGHDVFTVHYLGWRGVKNGSLLAQAAAAGFDVMVTMDVGVQYQQNLVTIPLAVIVLRAPSNDISDIRPLIPQILQALSGLQPKTVVSIG